MQGSLSRSLINELRLEREHAGGGGSSENKLPPIQYSWIKSWLPFTLIFFPLCVNAGAAPATSTGNRQLKLTRRGCRRTSVNSSSTNLLAPEVWLWPAHHLLAPLLRLLPAGQRSDPLSQTLTGLIVSDKAVLVRRRQRGSNNPQH